jgi:Flp pilus assembly protein TadB
MQTIILVAQTLALILAGWGFWLVIVALIVRINPFQKSEEIRADAHTEYADRVVPLMHEELPNMHAIDDPRERVAAVKKIIDHNKKWDKAQSKMRRDLDKADDEEVNDDLRLIVCGVVVVVVVVLLACGGLLYAEGLL